TVTSRIKLGTSIAVAFPRSPMILAHICWDLAKASGGRFILGLGSQVKGHNERRFSVKWEQPVKKLREVVLSLRAIWDAWQNGTKLDFRGEFYQFTLMTPFFSPGPLDHPKIPIYVAGVNPLITRLAGEVADGFYVHPLHSRKFIRDTIIPDLEAGAQRVNRDRREVKITTQCFAAIGESASEIAEQRERIREQLSFYASTRTYKPALDAHGWGDVCFRLSEMAAKGEWKKMMGEITDEMIDAYSVSGSPAEIPDLVRARYDGLLDRVSLYFPFVPGKHDARWRAIVEGMKS
ncbi:MAG: TIGR03617 family F420-dependent LLM class oxidoreductase, partial [Candidatus Binatia bacterium]